MKKTIKGYAVSWEGNIDTWLLDNGSAVLAIFKTKSDAEIYNHMVSSDNQDITSCAVTFTLPTKKK